MSLSIRLALSIFMVVLCAQGSRTLAAEGTARPAASAKAYAHYLQARMAGEHGDLQSAAEELRSAIAYDNSAQLHLVLAQVLARLAQPVPAEVEARRALEGDPKGPAGAEALFLLGRLHAAQRQPALAIQELQRAIQLELALAKEEDGRRTPPGPWRLLAELYLEAGDEQAAARTYQELADRVPNGGGGFREMGSVYLERKDLPRAEKYLKKALEKDRRDIEVWRRLGVLESARRRPAEARKAYQTVLSLDSEALDALFALGKLSLEAGDEAGARTHFTQLLRLAPEEGTARVNVALAWIEAHRPAEAAGLVDEGLEAKPGDSRLLFVRGLVLQVQRRWVDAARAFGAVDSEDQDLWVNARVDQAFCLANAGRHDEALRALVAPLAGRPGSTKLLMAKAHVLGRAGKYGEAVELLERTLKERERDQSDPEGISELYEALASNLEKAGRGAQAIDLLERAIAKRPGDPSLLYTLGAIREKAGDHDGAMERMKAILAIEPDYAEALNFIGYSYADRGVKLDEAEKLIHRALELRPESGSFLDSLGWLYFRKGEYAQALRTLQKADTLSGPEPTILEHLGDTYRLLRRPSDAASAYRRALKSFDEGGEPERPDQQKLIERKLRELEIRPAQR